MQPNPTPQRINAANLLPQHLRSLMPIKGEAAHRKVANDKILYVDGVPKDWPCRIAARYVLHAAQDGGYGIICIVKPPSHKHEFKVYDIVKVTKKWTGPSLAGFKLRDDCWFDERKKIWAMGHKPNPNASIATL